MDAPAPWPRRTVLPVGVFVIAISLYTALCAGPPGSDPAGVVAATVLLLGFPVCLGCLVSVRGRDLWVGPALAWVGAAPAVVFTVELWGETDRTSRPWPGAAVVDVVQHGAWVWNVAGFTALCLVFPSGPARGRRWRGFAWCAVAIGVLAHALTSWIGAMSDVPMAVEIPVALTVFGGLLTVLGTAVYVLVSRYRHGDERTRLQLRWLIAGAATVPVMLACGWIAQEAADAPVGVAYTGFLVAMLVAVPASVAVAVLRYDLFDIDRLLGSSLAWLVTAVASAGLFATVVAGAGELLGGFRSVGTMGAAFAVALVLLPMHRRVHEAVGRTVDRDRYVIASRVQRFVRDVRDGTATPEGVEELLREVLADPGLLLLMKLPGGDADAYVDFAGRTTAPPPDATRVPLRTGSTDVGVIVLGRTSVRRLRRAREAAVMAGLPIEVSRLRLELRTALEDVRRSRTRLVLASAEERRRLEQDLHDGAQQQLVAAGMRLRSVQRRLVSGSTEHRDLDGVVEALEASIAELRRLAHGIRPSRLDDGLSGALQSLVEDSPVPARLTVADIEVSEMVATTVYFVVSEAYANVLKHAHAHELVINVAHDDDELVVEIRDDGVGGATGGMTSVSDRVASAGGEMSVRSVRGEGTTVKAVIPCADRRGR